MTTEKGAETGVSGKIARLRADNARLRKLAVELETDVRELHAVMETRQSRPAVAPAHGLVVVSGYERRARVP
jgi:hypothetical protein